MQHKNFPDSFYYEDWFASLISGNPIMEQLSTEHIEAAFNSLSDAQREAIESQVSNLSDQHKRLIHDRYSDQVREKVREIKELMYAISISTKK